MIHPPSFLEFVLFIGGKTIEKDVCSDDHQHQQEGIHIVQIAASPDIDTDQQAAQI